MCASVCETCCLVATTRCHTTLSEFMRVEMKHRLWQQHRQRQTQMHSVLAHTGQEGEGVPGKEKEMNWRFLAADGKIHCNRMFAFDYVYRTHAVHKVHSIYTCTQHIHLGNLYQAAHSCESRNANYKWVSGGIYCLWHSPTYTANKCTQAHTLRHSR